MIEKIIKVRQFHSYEAVVETIWDISNEVVAATVKTEREKGIGCTAITGVHSVANLCNVERTVI